MKINDITKLTNYKWLNLFEIGYTDNTGNNNAWLMASRRQQPLSAEGAEIPDAAIIIARHAETRKLVLLREFRVILNGWQYAFPAGLLDEGETVEIAAAREFYEETGLTLTKIIKVSPPLYSSAGMTDETISLVLAECRGMPVKLMGRSEEAETLLVTRQEARDIMADADVAFDARAWLGLLLFSAGVFWEDD